VPRNPAFLRTLLVVFGLVPIGAWIAVASTLEPSGLGRSIGKAILVVLSPLPAGGLLMILGGAMFAAKPGAARIVATIGAGMVFVGALFLAVVWARRFTGCGSRTGICESELLQTLVLVVYAAVHVALIVLVWRPASDADVVRRFP
jgi:hypothetical protein